MLCPVLWASPGGFLLVMRAAVPLSEMMSPKEYQEAFEKWDYMPGEDGCPFEPKESDWGWFMGRRVALDYSTPAWGKISRATDCPASLACALSSAGGG